jgi:anthranilate synthase component II
LILLLDNYDSFTGNLLHALQQSGCEVLLQQNDRTDPAAIEALRPTGIVLSPGPRRPSQAGRLMEIVAAFCERLPMLGICLGHQALGEYFGARLVHGSEPVHGKTAWVRHDGDPLFAGLEPVFEAMRYHSLVLEALPSSLRCTAVSQDGVIMGLRHNSLPLWGLQFHPESIGTPGGTRMLRNWLELAGEPLTQPNEERPFPRKPTEQKMVF